MNSNRTLRHATAFGLATIVTLAILGSVDSLATRPAQQLQMAQRQQLQQPATTQVVAADARRAAKS